jgi:transcriptional regulator with XRE-family HTH domain
MENLHLSKEKHIGRNIAKIRELRGIKQKTLAVDLGLSQQAICKLEKEETIGEERLKQVADALGVTPEIIENFDEESVIYNINNVQYNTVTDSTFEQGSGIAGQMTNNFNPIEKVTELYERLLESEKEKLDLVKKFKKQE